MPMRTPPDCSRGSPQLASPTASGEAPSGLELAEQRTDRRPAQALALLQQARQILGAGLAGGVDSLLGGLGAGGRGEDDVQLGAHALHFLRLPRVEPADELVEQGV